MVGLLALSITDKKGLRTAGPPPSPSSSLLLPSKEKKKSQSSSVSVAHTTRTRGPDIAGGFFRTSINSSNTTPPRRHNEQVRRYGDGPCWGRQGARACDGLTLPSKTLLHMLTVAVTSSTVHILLSTHHTSAAQSTICILHQPRPCRREL
jgi:hypothetical protein